MKKIEDIESKERKRRKQVVYQLENARRDVSIVKRWLDAPKEDPYWEQWTPEQRSELHRIHRQLTEIQLDLRSLTLQFFDNENPDETTLRPAKLT